ncbi:MAG: hypothetical protein QW156_04705 [Candidatus Aenigmatarchaeota archaeon]
MKLKEMILAVLRTGRQNAQTQWEIAEQTGINPREVRRLIAELIEVDGYAIGSTPHEPAGYYLCETEDELKENYERLMRQAKKIMLRASAFQRNEQAQSIRGQMRLIK